MAQALFEELEHELAAFGVLGHIGLGDLGVLAADHVAHDLNLTGSDTGVHQLGTCSFQFFHVLSPLTFQQSCCRRGAERTRGRELTQLMSDHVLGHIDRNVTAAVMDSDGVADKGRKIVEERLQVLMTFFSPALFISSTRFSSSGSGKRAFLNTSAHYLFPPYFALRRLTMNLSVAFFFLRVL